MERDRFEDLVLQYASDKRHRDTLTLGPKGIVRFTYNAATFREQSLAADRPGEGHVRLLRMVQRNLRRAAAASAKWDAKKARDSVSYAASCKLRDVLRGWEGLDEF
ncbi:hypothetical protein LZ554_001003 [Drepanopeziza brunnea f. sp. 'monogermtubi']|nr:hypothetical protein LZ554_001003 [Drepanopeziza brunnea f. sp. 'monogermtubi']